MKNTQKSTVTPIYSQLPPTAILDWKVFSNEALTGINKLLKPFGIKLADIEQPGMDNYRLLVEVI
jgi:hypothetical protein